jgi:hypothetical protein
LDHNSNQYSLIQSTEFDGNPNFWIWIKHFFFELKDYNSNSLSLSWFFSKTDWRSEVTKTGWFSPIQLLLYYSINNHIINFSIINHFPILCVHVQTCESCSRNEREKEGPFQGKFWRNDQLYQSTWGDF